MSGKKKEQEPKKLDLSKYMVPDELLRWDCSPTLFENVLTETGTTADLKPEKLWDAVKGQEDAKTILSLALMTDRNVILSGAPGVGKSMLIKGIAEKYSEENPGIQLTDQMLLYNPKEPDRPQVVKVATPFGRELTDEINELVTKLFNGELKSKKKKGKAKNLLLTRADKEFEKIVDEEFEKEVEKLKEKYGSNRDSKPNGIISILLLRKPKETIYDKISDKSNAATFKYDIGVMVKSTPDPDDFRRREGFIRMAHHEGNINLDDLDEYQQTEKEIKENVAEKVLKRLNSKKGGVYLFLTDVVEELYQKYSAQKDKFAEGDFEKVVGLLQRIDTEIRDIEKGRPGFMMKYGGLLFTIGGTAVAYTLLHSEVLAGFMLLTGMFMHMKNREAVARMDPRNKTMMDLYEKAKPEKLKINLVVDNSETKGIPIGHVGVDSWESSAGAAGHDPYNTVPAHIRCSAGDFQKANRGICESDELVVLLTATNPQTGAKMSDTMLTVLEDKKISIGGHGGGTSGNIRTEPLDADTLLIGCANADSWDKMSDKFAARFPLRIELNDKMPRTDENILSIAQFVANEVNRYNIEKGNRQSSDSGNEDQDKNNETNLENMASKIAAGKPIPHYSIEGLVEIVNRAAKWSQKPGHLTLVLRQLRNLVEVAGAIAAKEGSPTIDKEHVLKAIDIFRLQYKKTEEARLEGMEKGRYKIGYQGKEVGMINGLVINLGADGVPAFGFPVRIIATTYKDSKDDMHHLEGELFKDISQKSFRIITTYLKNRYQQDEDLEYLAGTVSFAQSYQGIEGDSASSAMTLALESKISNLPIRQNLAITGSMNEYGIIQPIGGENEKVEGYWKFINQLRKDDKYTESEEPPGVIVPYDNAPLMLDEDVVNDIQKGLFKVYYVKTIDEAREIVFGVPSEEVDMAIREGLETFKAKSPEASPASGTLNIPEGYALVPVESVKIKKKK